MIEFFAKGIPRGQPRPRAFARKFGGTYQARVYDPGTAEGWKSCVAAAAKDYIPASPIVGPVRVDLKFYFPRPKAHFTKKGLRAEAPMFHTMKPDFDNLAKAVTDAMTLLGFWKDDGQICSTLVVKLYAGVEAPGCRIVVVEL